MLTKRNFKTYYKHVQKIHENRNMPIPVVGKEGDKTGSDVGFLHVDDTSPAGKALTQALGNLAKDKKAQIVVPTKQTAPVTPTTQNQQTQQNKLATNKPMGTLQPTAMKEAEVEEDKHSRLIKRLKKLVQHR